MMVLAAPGTHKVIFIEAILGEELDAIELIQAPAADKSTVLGLDFFIAEHSIEYRSLRRHISHVVNNNL